MAGPLYNEARTDEERFVPLQEGDLDEPPGLFTFTGRGLSAAAGQAAADVPGRLDERRSLILNDHARQVAKDSGRSPFAYSMPSGDTPVATVPMLNEAALWDDIYQRRKTDPGYMADLGAGPDALTAKLSAEMAGETRVRARAMASQGMLANLLGAVPGSFTDIVNLATLPIAAERAGASIFQRVLTGSLVNSWIEGIETPLIKAERRAQGEPDMTPGEQFEQQLGAFVAGGVLTSAHIGGGALVKKGVSLIPADARARLKNMTRPSQLAAAFRATKPEAEWTPSERAAVHVAERQGEIDGSSPDPDNLHVTGQHAEMIDEKLNELHREPVPRSERYAGLPEWPRHPNGKAKLLGELSVGEMRGMGFNDRRIAAIRGEHVEQPPVGSHMGPDGVWITPAGERWGSAGEAAPGEAPSPGEVVAPIIGEDGAIVPADPALVAERPAVPEGEPVLPAEPAPLATRPIEELPTAMLGDVTSVAYDAPVHPETGDQRLSLRPDEIAALREHGVTIDDAGNIRGDEVERLMAERARRQAARESGAVEPALTEQGQRRLDERRRQAETPVAPNAPADATDETLLSAAMVAAKGPPGFSIENPHGEGMLYSVFRDEHGDAKGVVRYPSTPEVREPQPGYKVGIASYVDPAYRRQGIASRLYDQLRAAGHDIDALSGTEDLTPAGAAFVNARRAGLRDALAAGDRPTPAKQDALDAAGLGDETPIDFETYERFSDPGGEGSQAVSDSMWHDIRAEMEAEQAAIDAAAAGRDPTRGRAFRPGATGEADDLLAFIAKNGGLKDDIGVPPELREGHNLRGRGRLVSGAIVGKKRRVGGGGAMLPAKVKGRFMFSGAGMTVDEAAEKAWAAGYFGPSDEVPRPTVSEMIDAMVDSVDNPLYHPDDLAAVAGRDERRRAGRMTEQQNEARGHVYDAANERGVELDDDEIAAIGDHVIKYDLDPHAAIDHHINQVFATELERAYQDAGLEPDYEAAFGPGEPGRAGPDAGRGAPPAQAGAGAEGGGGRAGEPGVAPEDGAGRRADGADGGQAALDVEPTLDLGAAVDPNIAAKAAQELGLAAQQPLRGERATGVAQTDIMPEGLFGGAEEPGMMIDMGDGKGARRIEDIDAELKRQEAGIAAARKCLE